ncbi:molybdenum cofactor guanylyltransferase [Rubripirellula sp.]|jgi:molybdenum cofactor guanylyltransferase|nr:molybdenum cofactor guanylyltransferase [Rubripirellula sp.]MDB4634086.1 molybdenum cofactor guanylyltransferase [Rubripirellula sp.]
MQSILGVVLCGGNSTRMGRDKSTIHHQNGLNFIEHAIERLRPICDEVCLAGRSNSSADLVALPDLIPNQGPIFGVLQALDYAANQIGRKQKHQACLITPVDMPYLTTDDLRKLMLSWQIEKDLTYAVSGPERKTQPLVGIYPLRLHNAISLHAKTDSSLMRWIKKQDATQIALDEAHCQNINRPEDLTGI